MGLTALPVASDRSDALMESRRDASDYNKNCSHNKFYHQIFFLPLWDTLHILSYGGIF